MICAVPLTLNRISIFCVHERTKMNTAWCLYHNGNNCEVWNMRILHKSLWVLLVSGGRLYCWLENILYTHIYNSLELYDIAEKRQCKISDSWVQSGFTISLYCSHLLKACVAVTSYKGCLCQVIWLDNVVQIRRYGALTWNWFLNKKLNILLLLYWQDWWCIKSWLKGNAKRWENKQWLVMWDYIGG